MLLKRERKRFHYFFVDRLSKQLASCVAAALPFTNPSRHNLRGNVFLNMFWKIPWAEEYGSLHDASPNQSPENRCVWLSLYLNNASFEYRFFSDIAVFASKDNKLHRSYHIRSDHVRPTYTQAEHNATSNNQANHSHGLWHSPDHFVQYVPRCPREGSGIRGELRQFWDPLGWIDIHIRVIPQNFDCGNKEGVTSDRYARACPLHLIDHSNGMLAWFYNVPCLMQSNTLASIMRSNV